MRQNEKFRKDIERHRLSVVEAQSNEREREKANEVWLCAQGQSHIVAWGGRGPCKKKKKFPLDYEEKINRPPQHYTAGPHTHLSTLNQKLGTLSNFLKKNYLFYFQAKKKKNPKKIWTKIWKKKKIYTYITKPSPSMASQAHGEPITGSSLTGHGKPILNQKKKNTESEIKPNQPITSLVPGITSRRRWQRD